MKTGEWVRRAARGEGLVITERGRPVASLIPYREGDAGRSFRDRPVLPEFEAPQAEQGRGEGDHRRVGGHCQHAHGCTAAWASTQVDVNHVAQALYPAHRWSLRHRRGPVVRGYGRRRWRRHDEHAAAVLNLTDISIGARAAQLAVVTRWSEGALVSLRGEVFEASGRTVEVIDAVGAGDRFQAALLGVAMPWVLHEWSDVLGLEREAIAAWREMDVAVGLEAATGLPVSVYNDLGLPLK